MFIKVRDFVLAVFEDVIQQLLPEVIHAVATVGTLEYKKELTVFVAVQHVCSCPAGRIPEYDHTLGRISQEVGDPYACVLTVIRRDGRPDDILWESHLFVTKGVDQVLECIGVVGCSHSKSLSFVHSIFVKKAYQFYATFFAI